MLRLFKQVFIRLLTSIVNPSIHTKCVSLSNQKCKIQPTFIKLQPNKYIQRLHCYLSAINLDRCFGTCNSVNDLFNK